MAVKWPNYSILCAGRRCACKGPHVWYACSMLNQLCTLGGDFSGPRCHLGCLRFRCEAQFLRLILPVVPAQSGEKPSSLENFLWREYHYVRDLVIIYKIILYPKNEIHNTGYEGPTERHNRQLTQNYLRMSVHPVTRRRLPRWSLIFGSLCVFRRQRSGVCVFRKTIMYQRPHNEALNRRLIICKFVPLVGIPACW